MDAESQRIEEDLRGLVQGEVRCDELFTQLYASDASNSAIEKARNGRYRERAFRSLPPALREKYFVRQDGGSMPIPELRARITSWSVVNLLSTDEVTPYAQFPIVFCRNAFIYFSPRSIKRVVDQLAARMPSPGYLCVGASESLLTLTSAFSLEEIDRAFVYVKRSPDE